MCSSGFWFEFWLRVNFSQGFCANRSHKLGCVKDLSTLRKTFYPVVQMIKVNRALSRPLKCVEEQSRPFRVRCVAFCLVYALNYKHRVETEIRNTFWFDSRDQWYHKTVETMIGDVIDTLTKTESVVNQGFVRKVKKHHRFSCSKSWYVNQVFSFTLRNFPSQFWELCTVNNAKMQKNLPKGVVLTVWTRWRYPDEVRKCKICIG